MFFVYSFLFFTSRRAEERSKEKVKQAIFYQRSADFRNKIFTGTIHRTDFKMKLSLAFKWQFQGEKC